MKTTTKKELKRMQVKKEISNLQKDIENIITYKHEGKMSGMLSMSTPCSLNERCAKNAQIKGSICEKCYAQRLMKMRKQLEEKLKKAMHILTTIELEKEDIPFINAAYFRFEAFGDLNNALQFKNYMTIAKYNKHCNFAIWTKNPDIIKTSLQIYGDIIPKNVIIIYSSLFINKYQDINKIKEAYPFIEKIFTVYSSEDIAAENGCKINCGARHCATCLKCYKHNKIYQLNELLK